MTHTMTSAPTPAPRRVSRRTLFRGTGLALATAALGMASLPAEASSTYRVQPGDTLGGIARAFGVSTSSLAANNHIANPSLIQIGQVLTIGGTASAASVAARPSSGVVAIAEAYLGYPYAWGGTYPSTGFDCSGFVWYVYQRAGNPIPRDLWGQLGSGFAVSYGNLQPGDLVFFADTYEDGLSHVGIYVGGGQFVHAADYGIGVTTSSLYGGYWAEHYYAACRPD